MRDSLEDLRHDLHLKLQDIRARADALSPLDIHARMDAIRGDADRAGLQALEGLARHSAQLALLPGCRIATQACLAHAGDALAAGSAADRQAVMAAIALRLN